MKPPVYLGDEVGACGWRLAGVRVCVPSRGSEAAALDEARAEAGLVLLSAALAARIDEAALTLAMAAPAPLTLVLPDPSGEAGVPDLASRLRTQLGLQG